MPWKGRSEECSALPPFLWVPDILNISLRAGVVSIVKVPRKDCVYCQHLHDRAIGRRLRRVTINVFRLAAMLPAPPSIVPVLKAVHKPIFHHRAVAERVVPAANRWLRAMRSRQPMIVPTTVHRHQHSSRRHRHARNQRHARRHRCPKPHTRTPIVHRPRHIAPRAGDRVGASEMAADQLVATPRPLHHLDGLAVCEACVTMRTGVRRRDEGLVCLPVGAAQEVGEEAAGL